MDGDLSSSAGTSAFERRIEVAFVVIDYWRYDAAAGIVKGIAVDPLDFKILNLK